MRNKTKPNTTPPKSIFPIVHFTAYSRVSKHLLSQVKETNLSMTQYYIKIQLKLRQWRECQPRVSHCFKGWSFKNEWDTSLVLYKGCTQVRDKSMHRNTVSSWACWPEFDPWDLHSEGKALTPGKCPWSPHMCPGACTGTCMCTRTCTHKHTLIAECSKSFPKIRIWGLGRRLLRGESTC